MKWLSLTAADENESYALLRHIDEHPGATALDLQQVVGFSGNRFKGLLQELWQLGFIYPVEDQYWYFTHRGKESFDAMEGTFNPSAVGRRTPSQRYETAHTLTEDEFFTKLFTPSMEWFKANHPEYTETIKALESNPRNWKGFAADIYKLYNGKYTRFIERNKDEPKYAYPAVMSSIEQAIEQIINKGVQLYHPFLKGKVPSLVEYRVSQEAAQAFIQENGEEWIQSWLKSLFKAYPMGTVISSQDIQDKITSWLKDYKLPRGADRKKFTMYVLDMVGKRMPTDLPVFTLQTSSKRIIGELIDLMLPTVPTPAGKVYSTFLNTAKNAGRKDWKQILSGVMSQNDWSGHNFDHCDFSNITISEAGFRKTILTHTIWEGSIVTACDFTESNATGSSFSPQVFKSNNVQDMDFTDASFPKRFKFDKSNTGEPKNFMYTDVALNKEALPEIYQRPRTVHRALPLDPEDTEDATTLVRALSFILRGRDVYTSLKFTISALTDQQVQELRAWIEDPTKTPSFLVSGQSAKWLIDVNREKPNLTDLGFSKNDVNMLFGHARNFDATGVAVQQKTETPREKMQREVKEKVQQFVDTYRSTPSVPKQALLDLITFNKEGQLTAIISSTYGDKLSIQDLRALFDSLVSNLQGYHLNEYVPPKNRYRPFPNYSRTDTLKQQGYTATEAGGTQFGVVIKPIIDQMPPDLAYGTSLVLEHGTQHLGGAIAFSRIAPMIIEQTSPTSGAQSKIKHVWLVSEMQSDPMQHLARNRGRDEYGNVFYKGGKLTQLGERMRKQYGHWPENLLNAILQHAGDSGVDEVWMARGDDVSKKTANTYNSEPADWTPYYDEPAKTFGGQLKDVGTPVNIDPGSQYKYTSTKFWVIPIKQEKKSSMVFSFEPEEVPPQNGDRVQLKLDDDILQALHDIKGAGYTRHILQKLKNATGTVSHVDPPYKHFLMVFDDSELQAHADASGGFRPPFDVVTIIQRKSSSRLSFLEDDYDWEDIKRELLQHIKWVIEYNRPKFPEVEKYVDDDLIAQFAYRTFYKEKGYEEEEKDLDFVKRVQEIMTELGYPVLSPPYLDWLYWMQLALTDARRWIKQQRDHISPDMRVSDQELARDWFKVWMSGMDKNPDIQGARWYKPVFVETIRRIMDDKGYGDVLSIGFIPPPPPSAEQVTTPHDTGEGEKEFVDPTGRPEKPEPGHEETPPTEIPGLKFEAPSHTEIVDNLLDALNEAVRTGKTDVAERIKQQLAELSKETSLKLSFDVEDDPTDVQRYNRDEYGDDFMDGKRRLQEAVRKGECSAEDALDFEASLSYFWTIINPQLKFHLGEGVIDKPGNSGPIDAIRVAPAKSRLAEYLIEGKIWRDDYDGLRRIGGVESSLKLSFEVQPGTGKLPPDIAKRVESLWSGSRNEFISTFLDDANIRDIARQVHQYAPELTKLLNSLHNAAVRTHKYVREVYGDDLEELPAVDEDEFLSPPTYALLGKFTKWVHDNLDVNTES